jgi:hypothetical protein
MNMQSGKKPFETLESRTMMSAAPLFDAAVKEDRLQIRIDLLKFNSDAYADSATLLTDNRALKADKLHSNTVLQPLVATLRSDVHSFDLTLKADRLNEASAVLADEAVVVKQLKQIFLDRKDPTALAADKTVLITDRAKLQSDMVAGITQRITDRQSETAQITLDSDAILTALPTSGASTQLTADVTSWLTDKSTALTRLTTDLTKLSNDRATLIADLNAENS